MHFSFRGLSGDHLLIPLKARVKEVGRRPGEEGLPASVAREEPDRVRAAPAGSEDELLLERLCGKMVTLAGRRRGCFPEADWPCDVVHCRDGEGLEAAVSRADAVRTRGSCCWLWRGA
jgi:hypothetical protein